MEKERFFEEIKSYPQSMLTDFLIGIKDANLTVCHGDYDRIFDVLYKQISMDEKILGILNRAICCIKARPIREHDMVSFRLPYNDLYVEIKGVDYERNQPNLIVYKRLSDGKTISSKVGRFFIDQMKSVGFVNDLTMPFINRASELLTEDWKVFAYNLLGVTGRFVVDTDFESIYDSSCMRGRFHSCMVDGDCYQFYDKINCQAVSLRDDDDLIIARAILYNGVYDDDGNKYRFLERIYAAGDAEKRRLLFECEKRNLIDCYKIIGAGCGDAKAIKGVGSCEDIDFKEKRLHINCKIYSGDVVSYQDSFKWYDVETNRAYNDHNRLKDYVHLDITDGFVDYFVCNNCGRIVQSEADGYAIDGYLYCESCSCWSSYLHKAILSEDAICVTRSGTTDYVSKSVPVVYSRNLRSNLIAEEACRIIDRSGEPDYVIEDDLDSDEYIEVGDCFVNIEYLEDLIKHDIESEDDRYRFGQIENGLVQVGEYLCDFEYLGDLILKQQIG